MSRRFPLFHSKSFTDFKKHLPSILDIMLDDRYVRKEEFWKEKDNDVRKFYSKLEEGQQYEPHIFDIMKMAEDGNPAKIYLLKQFDDMTRKLFESIGFKFKKKFREIFKSKLFNLETLNYLSPIGEILCFYKFHFNPMMKILDIEFSLGDNRPTFDFLVDINGKEYLLEIYNAHPKRENNDYLEDLGKKILNKWNETRLKHTFGERRFLLVPIIWFTQIELTNKNDNVKNYFQRFLEHYNCIIFTPLSVYSINNKKEYVYKIDFLSNHLKELEKNTET